MTLWQYSQSAKGRIRKAVQRIESMPRAAGGIKKDTYTRQQLPTLGKAYDDIKKGKSGQFKLMGSSWTSPAEVPGQTVTAINLGQDLEKDDLCLLQRAALAYASNTDATNASTAWVVLQGGSSTTVTQKDQTFWAVGNYTWTLANPTEEKAGFTETLLKSPASSGVGNEVLGLKHVSDGLYSTTSDIVAYDANEDNFATSGPYSVTGPTGRYKVESHGSFGMARTTGAPQDPDNGFVLQVYTSLRMKRTTSPNYRDVNTGYTNVTRPGDTTYKWVVRTSPPGWMRISENSAEFAIPYVHSTTMTLTNGDWLTPIMTIVAPSEYYITPNSGTIVITKLPD